MVKPEYIIKIRSDKQLRTKIMYVTNKSLATIYNWLKDNDPKLSTNEVVTTVCVHFGVKPDDVLEPVKEFSL